MLLLIELIYKNKKKEMIISWLQNEAASKNKMDVLCPEKTIQNDTLHFQVV